MRIRSLSTAAFLLLPVLALAQQPPPPASPPPAGATPQVDLGVVRQQGRLDAGFRASSVSGDRARFNRFQDLREGAFLSGIRVERETGRWFFLGEAHNVGYRDQRFMGAAESIGRFKASFEWDQIPLFISGDTRSLQQNLGNGILDVDDGIQQAIQARTLTLADAMANVIPFDTRSRRHIAALDMTYMASRDVDVRLRVKSTGREGRNLQSFLLGTSPGAFTQELGIPIDDRTTDVRMGVEWANTRALLSAGIDASWFTNHIPTVQFDNPQRFTDISAGASKGLAAMWPSNSLVSFVAAGAYKLPARTRATANISIGRATQNEPLVAPTSNTALVAPSLMRGTAEAAADVVSMVYGLNSRPAEGLWLNARYRYYDYANKTQHFETTPITGDWTLGTGTVENEPLSVRRHTLDLDSSFAASRFAVLGAGFTREAAARSFRIFEDTTENIFRVTADSTGNAYVTARLKYEIADRQGSAFDGHLLEAVAEQPDMRHFDVANRRRTRATGSLTVTPVAWMNLSGSIADGRDDYADTGFGLRDNRSRSYGFGVDLMPMDTVMMGLSYLREKYTANQYSRTSNPGAQFLDPNRDWWIDSADRVETVVANLDLLRTLPNTDIRLSYDVSDGDATYVYGLKPTQTVFTGAASLQQLPRLSNRITGGRADVQYFLRQNVGVGIVYRFEDYAVRDFALDADTVTPLSAGTSTIYTGYMYRPYTAHTAWLRLTYLW